MAEPTSASVESLVGVYWATAFGSSTSPLQRNWTVTEGKREKSVYRDQIPMSEGAVPVLRKPGLVKSQCKYTGLGEDKFSGLGMTWAN